MPGERLQHSLRAVARRDEHERRGFVVVVLVERELASVRRPVPEVEAPAVAAKGLARGESDTKLSYSAPAEQGGVEVRNQRGQLEQAATARAQRAQQQAAPAAPPAQASNQRGAFGQRVEPSDEAPANRAERRAQAKKR